MKTTITALAMGFVCVTVTAAQADSKPRTHDGFHFQLQGGLGYYNVSVDDASDSSFSGMTIPLMVQMGGTVGGLAIGGGLMLDHAPSPTVKVNGTEVDTAITSQFVVGIGLYADYFADSIKEGLHFQGFVGWGGLETSFEGDVGGSDPTGLMTYVGAGYDVWISDQWKAGGMFRIVYGTPSQNSIGSTVLEPALVGTITWH